AEAARRLRCTPGAVRGRLAQARSRLRARLARRGFFVPAAALAAALSTRTASAAVPPALRDSTTRAALRLIEGAVASGASPAGWILETTGSLIMTKARVIGTAALLVAGVITAAWGLTPSRGSAEPARAPSEAAPRPRPAAAEEPVQYEATRAAL